MLRRKMKKFLATLCVVAMVTQSVADTTLFVHAQEVGNTETVAEEVVLDEATVSENAAEEVVAEETVVAEFEDVAESVEEIAEETVEVTVTTEDALAAPEGESESGLTNPYVHIEDDGKGGLDVYARATNFEDLMFIGNVDANGIFTIEKGWSGVGDSQFSGWKQIKGIRFEDGNRAGSIGKSAFSNCPNLESVDFSNCDELTVIRDSAFEGCTALKSVKFHANLQYIRKQAFANTALTEITFNPGLMILGESAFLNCKELTKVRVEAANMRCQTESGSVATNIFKGCNISEFELAYKASDNKDGENIIVPVSLFNGATFAEDATITIPNNIQEIGEAAFKNSNLKDIVFQDTKERPSVLSVIGKDAFNTCKSLETVTFPTTLQKIGEGAFSGSTVLNYIDIPDSVTEVGDNAFKGCIGLTNVQLSNATLKDKTGSSIFEGCKALERVEIPYGLDYIGKSEFKGCESLASLEIAESVKEIDTSAFEGCLSLKTVVLPEAMTEIANSTFKGCSELVYANLHEGITKIGNNAFDSCTRLQSNILPKTLISIGTNAYADCDAINTIEIPENVNSIGSTAFAGCNNLRTLRIDSLKITSCGAGIFSDCMIRDVTFPVGIEVIPANLFNQATFITDRTIIIPATVTEIGAGAFGGSQKYPVNVSRFVFEDGTKLKTIGKGAFQYCQAIENIDLPDTLETIGDTAFANCNKLTEIVIPENVTAIGKQAFSGCSVLSSIVYNAIGVTTSNDLIFEKCNVKSIVIGPKVAKFPAKLFKGAQFSVNSATGKEDMVTITIPKAVEEIGEYALPNISNLAEVIFESGSKLTTIGNYAFYQCVNMSSCNLPDGVTSIGNYAFDGCKALGTDAKKSFQLPKSLEHLGTAAFSNCPGLEEIVIPGALTDVYSTATATKPSTAALEQAFKNDTGIVSVSFDGASFQWIGTSAFEGCTKLERVAIPNGVTTIKGYAFKNCTALTEVVLPATITSIDSTAFAGCGSIYFHVVPGSEAEKWVKDKGYNSIEMIPITYELNGGQSNGGNPAGYEEGDDFTFKPATKHGYDFAGWYVDPSFNQEITSVAGCSGPITVYAKWTVKTFTITYELNGGTNNSGNPSTYTINDKITFKNPTKEGATFEGWFTNLTNTKSEVKEIATGSYGDIVLYAKWSGGNVDAPVATIASGSRVQKDTKVFLSTKTTGAVIYYTTNGSDPIRNGEKYVDGIVIDSAMTIKAVAIKAGGDASEVASFTYTLVNEATYWGDIAYGDRSEFSDATEVPEGIWVAGLPEEVDFTGAAITFDLRVYDGKKLLKEKTDYTVKYSNNKAAADKDAKKAPTVTITSKGNYKGKIALTFTINPIDLNEDCISVADMEFAATGKAIKPAPVVMNGATKLKAKTDYTVEFGNIQAAGKYQVRLVGKGNYGGTRNINVTVINATSLAKKAKITNLPKALPYDGGRPVKPNFNVVVGGVTLQEGVDYTTTYTNNKDAGTATVTVTGKGSYCESKSATFKIDPEGLINKATITLSSSSTPYTGTPCTIGTTVVTKEGKTLRYGIDYTQSYLKNTDAGTATVVLTGKGAYSGTAKKTFKIVAKDIDRLDTQIIDAKGNTFNPTDKITMEYVSGGVKPAVRLYMNSTLLKEGTDYTLSYADNTAAGSSATAKIIIKGKKNFKGTREIPFTITKKDLSNAIVMASDVAYKKEAGVVNGTTVIVKDENGNVLTQGVDYKIAGFTVVNATRTVDGATLLAAGKAINVKTHILPADTLVSVKITGMGNYASNSKYPSTATFRIYSKGISSAKVTVAPQTYNGSEVQPGVKDITSITLNGVTLMPGQYEIVGYTNNNKVGTGKMIIRGVGDYGGTKEVTFKILPKPFTLESIFNFFK